MLATSNPTRHALYLDGVIEQGDLLASADFLEQVGRRAADVAGMRILSLTVHDVEEDLTKLDSETFEDEGGKTLYALLSTSHLSLHGWPNRSIFMFDLVSCRRFDQAQVEALVRSELNVTSIVHRKVTDVVWPKPEEDRPRRLGDFNTELHSPYHSQR